MTNTSGSKGKRPTTRRIVFIVCSCLLPVALFGVVWLPLLASWFGVAETGPYVIAGLFLWFPLWVIAMIADPEEMNNSYW